MAARYHGQTSIGLGIRQLNRKDGESKMDYRLSHTAPGAWILPVAIAVYLLMPVQYVGMYLTIVISSLVLGFIIGSKGNTHGENTNGQ
jgi:hypothetical protein